MSFVLFILLTTVTVASATTSCLESVYQCVPLVDSDSPPSSCSVTSIDNCTEGAAATCQESDSLIAERIGLAKTGFFQSSCIYETCLVLLRKRYAESFGDAFHQKNYVTFCQNFGSPPAEPLTCSVQSAIDDVVDTISNLCLPGANGTCYAAAMNCIDFAYFDPNVVDVVEMCSKAQGVRQCIEGVKTGASCSGAAPTLLAAVDGMLENYERSCNDSRVCDWVIQNCLAAFAFDIPVESFEFSEYLCSKMTSIASCVDSRKSTNAACPAIFTPFLQQLGVNCNPQLCSAGLQSCFSKYNFDSRYLDTMTVEQYLHSWCGSVTNISACVNATGAMCQQPVSSELGTTLDGLCTAASGSASDAKCYWPALKCIYSNGIVRNKPALFWTESTDFLCDNINTTSQCLRTAEAGCSGTTDYRSAIASLRVVLETTCLPFCNSTAMSKCDDSLEYYLKTVWTGLGANLCGVLTKRMSCYARFIKSCDTGLSQTVVQQNLVIVNSILIAIDDVCLTADNSTGSTCASESAKCLSAFVKSLTESVDLLDTADICTSWTTAEQCLAGLQTSGTCKADEVKNINSTVKSIQSVIDSLPKCNIHTQCFIQQALECVGSLTVQINAVGTYQPPLRYDGTRDPRSCRTGDCHNPDTRVPEICIKYEFYLGSLCLDINKTLSCIDTKTRNCSGSINAELIDSARLEAAEFIQQCETVDYTCSIDEGMSFLEKVVDLGLKKMFAADISKPILCWWTEYYAELVYYRLVQCSPLVSDYLWKFVEAYVSYVSIGCQPPGPSDLPYPFLNDSLTTTCGLVDVESTLSELFKTITNTAVGVTVDPADIVRAWDVFIDKIGVITTTNADYDSGLCTEVLSTITKLKQRIQIIIDSLKPPAADLYDCEVDLVFVMDSSGSIATVDYDLMREFIKKLIRTFDVSSGKVRVGIMQFSYDVETIFDLKDYTSADDMIKALDKAVQMGYSTNTDQAIQRVRTHMHRNVAGDRKDIQNVVVIFTDGESNDPEQTLKEAKKLRDHSEMGTTTIITVGLGGGVNTDELNGVATSPASQNVFILDNFDLLPTIQTRLQQMICQKVCFLEDAYKCINDFKCYVSSNGLQGAGFVTPTNAAQKDQFCFVAEEKYKCLVDSMSSCDPARAATIFSAYYEQQTLVGYSCVGPCAAGPCQNGGICKETGSGNDATYRCTCSEGFTGTNCETQLCSDSDIRSCIHTPTGFVGIGNFTDFCQSIPDALDCLKQQESRCPRNAGVTVLKKVFEEFVAAFGASNASCTVAPVDNCNVESVSKACFTPHISKYGGKFFDTATGFILPEICGEVLKIGSCLIQRGCEGEAEALSDYFSAMCFAPPENCSLHELIILVKELRQNIWKIQFAKPPRHQNVVSPVKGLNSFECTCKQGKGDNGDDNEKNGRGGRKFNDDQTVDDTGYNTDLDVCGWVGDSWSATFEATAKCDSNWNIVVTALIEDLKRKYLDDGQCSDPCEDSCCSNGGTCVPSGYGYTCKCAPGYDGKCCQYASLAVCDPQQSSTCLVDLKNLLYFIFETPAPDHSLYCTNITASIECLSYYMLPCDVMDKATYKLITDFLTAKFDLDCGESPLGGTIDITCILTEEYKCIVSILEGVYIDPTSSSLCSVLESAATCSLSVKLQCDLGSGVSVTLAEQFGQAAWALYDSVCSPLCSISKVKACIEVFYDRVVFGIGTDNVCDVAASAVACVEQNTLNCPFIITSTIEESLNKLLVIVAGQCIPKPCAVSQCQNGGTCVPDLTSPKAYNCTCLIGFTGEFCEFVGCSAVNIVQCLLNVEAVFSGAWDTCPTVNCLQVNKSITCLEAQQTTCPGYSRQLTNVLSILKSVQLDNTCSSSAPSGCGTPPADCPLEDIQKCFNSYVSLVFQGVISGSGPEFGLLFDVWSGSYECMVTDVTRCTSGFETKLLEILKLITFKSNCSLPLVGTYLTYIETKVLRLREQPLLSPDVRLTVCSQLNTLELVIENLLSGCDRTDAAVLAVLKRVEDSKTSILDVCILPCLCNPCQNDGTCISQPGGKFKCDCVESYTGELCSDGPVDDVCKMIDPQERQDCGWPGISSEECVERGCCFDNTILNVKWCFVSELPIDGTNCDLNSAAECLVSLLTFVAYSGGSLTQETFCPKAKETLDCIQTRTVNCEDVQKNSLLTQLNDTVTAVGLSCYPPCDTRPCANGGTCQPDGTSSYKCLCPPGFDGPDCSTRLCDESAVEACLIPVTNAIIDGNIAAPDGLCGSISTTAKSCVTLKAAECSASLETTLTKIIQDNVAAFCSPSPACNVSLLIDTCLSIFASLTAPLWNNVTKEVDPNYCRKWSIVEKCTMDLDTCSVVVEAIKDSFVFYCPDYVTNNCSLASITDVLTKLERYAWEATHPATPLLPPASPPTTCTRTVTLTFAGSGEVYIDGVLQTLQNAASWSTADQIPIQDGAQLIAIKSSETTCGCYAGILVIVAGTDESIVTSDSWKCTASKSLPANWMTLEYDDRQWASAVVVANYGGGHWGSDVSGIPAGTTAKWIWTSHYQHTYTSTIDSPIYCRAFFGKRKLSLRVRNQFTLYVDGVEQSNLPSGDNTATVELEETTRLVAIMASASGASNPGILASITGNVLITDDTWLCTSTFVDGWMNLDTDTTWPNAFTYETNGATDSQLNGIGADAYWIWTDNKQDQTIYCRRGISLPKSVPVKPACAAPAGPPVADDGTKPCWYVESTLERLKNTLAYCDDTWMNKYEEISKELIANYSVGKYCGSPCDPNPCFNEGICSATVSGYSFSCACLPGFTGILCQNGSACSRVKAMECLTQVKVAVDVIISNFSVISSTVTIISDLESLEECLAVHLQPCTTVDTYVFVLIDIFIKYILERPSPPISCEQEKLAKCALDTINTIYFSGAYDTCTTLKEAYSCIRGVVDTCGPSVTTTLLSDRTWSTIETLCPNPNCSQSSALDCLTDLKQALTQSPSDKAVICPILTNTTQCVAAAVVGCDAAVKESILATVDVQRQEALSLCIDACKTAVCLNGGTCVPAAGGQKTCHCPPGFTGEICEFPTGCNLGAVQSCLDAEYRAIINGLFDPCRPVNCSIVSRLDQCLTANTAACSATVNLMVSTVKTALNQLVSIPGVCINESSQLPTTCVTPSILCDYGLLVDTAQLYLDAVFSQYFNFPGPDFTAICLRWNFTVEVFASVTCQEMSVYLSRSQTWLGSLLNTSCSPHCPATGSLPTVPDCLAELIKLVNNVAYTVFTTLEEHNVFCALVEASGSCVQSALSFCPDASTEQQLATYKTQIATTCPMPCLNNVCLPDAVCVPLSFDQYVCICDPLLPVAICDTVVDCQLNEAYKCVESVETFIQTNQYVSHDAEFATRFCSLLVSTQECVNTKTLHCPENLVSPIYSELLLYQNYVNLTCIKACDSSPCLNNGVCVQNLTDIALYTCDCPPGYTGPNCEGGTCDIDAINQCFYPTLNALFTNNITDLCKLVTELSNCVNNAVVQCPADVVLVVKAAQENLYSEILPFCSTGTSGNCSLQLLDSTCIKPILASTYAYLLNPSAGQLAYICKLWSDVDVCVTKNFGSSCSELIASLDVLFGELCVIPPNPNCSLYTVIKFQGVLEMRMWQAQNNWANGVWYDGMTYELWKSAESTLSQISKYIPVTFKFEIEDDSLYACWYIDSIVEQMVKSVNGCVDNSWRNSVSEGITNLTTIYLKEGSCSKPCEPNPCLAGGVCEPRGNYGFSCKCPPGFSGDFCEENPPCDLSASYGCVQALKRLIDTISASSKWYTQAGACSDLEEVRSCFESNMFTCESYYEDAFASVNVSLSYLEDNFCNEESGVGEATCETKTVIECQYSYLSKLISSSSPQSVSPDYLCSLLDKQEHCSKNVTTICGDDVSTVGERYSELSFGSQQTSCPNPNCSLTTFTSCVTEMLEIIDNNANDTDFCTQVFEKKDCAEKSTEDCPDEIKSKVTEAVKKVLTSVSCLQPCETLPCRNGGSCIETSSTTFQCTCAEGFTGDRCQFETGCDFVSVRTCLNTSTSTIVTGLLDPCKNPVDCSTLDTLTNCLTEKTRECDNITVANFKRLTQGIHEIHYICNTSRLGPPGCESPQCDVNTLQKLLTDLLTRLFDQYSTPAGVDYLELCSFWNKTISDLTKISTSCSQDIIKTVQEITQWVSTWSNSVCTQVLCFPDASLECLNYMKTELQFTKNQPDILPAQQNEFCLDMENTRQCVVDNLKNCNSGSDEDLLMQLNETVTGVLEFCVFPCLSDPCLNGGTCVQTTYKTYSCLCTSEYTGTHCEYASLYQCSALSSSEVGCHAAQGSTISQSVRLDASIDVFCQEFNNFFITPSGYISFVNNSIVLDFKALCSTKYTVLAPLFAWQDCSCSDSGITYCVYNSFGSLDADAQAVMDRATADVRRYGGNGASAFTAMTVIVITWNNVYPNPCQYYKNKYSMTEGSTYQLVVAADSTKSYSIFIYEKVHVQNLVPNVFLGFNNRLGQCNALWHPVTADKADLLQVESNTGVLGKWFLPLFNGGSVCPPPSPESQCLSHLANTVDLSNVEDRPPCPCTGHQAAADPRFHFDYIDWFRYCFTYNVLIDAGTGRRFKQVCCYNPLAQDALFTNPPFAGYATLMDAPVSDATIYQTCCVQSSKYCNIFLQLRPIDVCSSYYGPVQALLWGDPHFITLDGVSYTFNGIGEYTMIATRSKSFVLQTRTAQYFDASRNLYNASCFVAFAAQEVGYPKVELRLNDARDDVEILINGTQMTMNGITQSQIYLSWQPGSVNITFPGGWTLSVGIANRMLMILYTAIPLSAWNNTEGLLGLYDGNPKNDLRDPAGVIYPDTSPVTELHYNFGLQWQIQASESLFTYPAGKTSTDYITKSFVPAFDSPCTTSNDNLTASSLCGTNKGCYYDYCVTRDPQIASKTLATQNAYLANRQTLQTRSPSLTIVGLEEEFARTGRYIINATLNQPVTFTLKASSPLAAQLKIVIVGNVSNQSTTFLNQTTGEFRWTPMSLTPVDVSFIATDPSGAVSSLLQVTVTVCSGCSQHGFCDFSSHVLLGNGTIFQKADCMCGIGWTGVECSDNFDACADNPCGVGNTGCRDMTPQEQNGTGLAYTCSQCLPGYALYRQQCADVDECLTRTALCNQNCSNTYGSYVCSCHPGYRLDGLHTCLDINECTEGTNTCAPPEVCINKDGTYACTSHHVVVRIKLVLDWRSDYNDSNSSLFRAIKNATETVFKQLFTSAAYVKVIKCFESSVGVEFNITYENGLTQQEVANVQRLIIDYLNQHDWKIGAAAVKETPSVSYNGQTLPAPNPCTDGTTTVCQNGGTCSLTSSGVGYAPPTCSCKPGYTGSDCAQVSPSASSSTVQPPGQSTTPSSGTQTTQSSSGNDGQKRIILATVLPVIGAAILIILVTIGVLMCIRQRRTYSGHLMDEEPLGRARGTRIHQWWPSRPKSMN